MQRILTAAEMRDADRATIERGIPGIILMENAAAAVVDALVERYPPLREQRLWILCGKGNNGGDGLAVARLLKVRGLQPDCDIALFADPTSLEGDAAANLKMLEAIGAAPRVVSNADDWRELRFEVLPATLIVDALLGTGLKGDARGLAGEVIADLNRNFSHCKVVAVDIPSGMPSDAGTPLGESLEADCTVTFTAPKPAQVFPPGSRRVGELRVAPIGTSQAILDSIPGDPLGLIEPKDFAVLLADRDSGGHKGSYGHVAVVGGSRSKPGAVAMAGTAALRMGAGLVTVVTSAGACAAVAGTTPELMTLPAAELEDGSMGAAAFEPEWLTGKTVVAVGPGIGVGRENQALARRVVRESPLPVVVDADAITALADSEDVTNQRGSALILTPHPGEMSRLVRLTTEQVQRDRVSVARNFAVERGVYLVLKGERTLIAAPDGLVLVNPTGTPAMATAGSGDVLTGMIAGMMAQHPGGRIETVVAAAVYLHGKAGEIAGQSWGERSMLATDMLAALPRAIFASA